MKIRPFTVFMATVATAGFVQACSLPEICDYESGKHYDAHGECVADTDEECGVYRMDCTKSFRTGVVRGKCEKSTCTATECDEDASFYLDENINQCIQRCECDRYGNHVTTTECNAPKIQACIDLECPKENVYCIRTAQELRYLPEWIKLQREEDEAGQTKELSIYLLKDIDLNEHEDNQHVWDAFSIDNIKFTAFGDEIKNIQYKNGTLEQGLFDKIDHSLIANIGVELSVEGDKGYGILANEVSDSQLYHLSVQGKVNFTGKDAQNSDVARIEENLNDTEYCPNGVGGMIGTVKNSSLNNLHIGAQIDVEAAEKSIVGGMAGVLCSSMLSCDKECSYEVQKVSGNHYVGGMVGILKNSTVQGTSGLVHAVTGKQNVGGYVGYIHEDSTVQDAVHDFENIQGEDNVGGFCGLNRGYMDTVKITTPTGTVQGKNYVGGLCGDLRGSMNEITSFALDVKGENFVGGMVGRMLGVIEVTHHGIAGRVSGKNNVGGMIGSMELGTLSGEDTGIALLGEHNNVQIVEGEHGIGGVIGVFLGGFVDDLNSTVKEVKGQHLVGGFFGRVGRNISSKDDGDEALFYISNVDNIVELVHDTGMTPTVEDTQDGIGGFAGRIERETHLAYIDNHVHEVSAQANQYVGGFVGYQDGYVSDVDNFLVKLTGDVPGSSIGGLVGYLDSHGIIQNISHDVSDDQAIITGTGFTGGCIGVCDGIVVNADSKINKLISKEHGVGGFVGRVEIHGIIKDVSNKVRLILTPLFGGGFASECDGEVADVDSQVDQVVGASFIGGTFTGVGGKLSSIMSRVGLVKQVSCTIEEKPDNDTDCISVQYDSEATKVCYGVDNKWMYYDCVRGGVIGGFVAYGDGMYNSEYANVTSIVADVIGNQYVGGFMGLYSYRYYNLRQVYLENVASWANVHGERETSGLFIGNIGTDDPNLMSTNSFYARNIVMMGHYYDQNSDTEEANNYLIGTKSIEVNEQGQSIIPGKINIELAYAYCYTDNCVFDHDPISSTFTSILRPEYVENGEVSDSIKTVLENLIHHQSDGKRPSVLWSVKKETLDPWKTATEERPIFIVEKDNR